MLGAASQCKNLATFMKMKSKRIPLGRNPLSDAPCRNPGIVLNEQGPGRHPRDAPCRDLDTVGVLTPIPLRLGLGRPGSEGPVR